MEALHGHVPLRAFCCADAALLRPAPGESGEKPALFCLFFRPVSSAAQSCPTLRDPTDCSTPGLPVHHQLPEFTQTHVHRVADAIQPSHPLPSPSPPTCNLSQHQGFPVIQFFASGGQSIGVSASTSVLPMNIQDRFPLGWTGWISLQSKGLSRVFSSTTVQKHQFFSAQLSLISNSHSDYFPVTTGKTIDLTPQALVGKVMSLLLNMLSRLVIAFLPRSKRLLISWLQSPSAVILEPRKINSDTVSTVSPSICHEVMGPDAMIFIF